jgi:hypothetical protein
MRHITLLFSLFFLFPFIIVAQTITTKESRCVNTGEITISGTVGAGGPYQFSFTNYPPAYTPSGIQTTNTDLVQFSIFKIYRSMVIMFCLVIMITLLL